MVTSRVILNYAFAEPFRPLRIQTASGRVFAVMQPEMIRVGRDDLMIFSLDSDDPRVHDDWNAMSLDRIKAISLLEGHAARE